MFPNLLHILAPQEQIPGAGDEDLETLQSSLPGREKTIMVSVEES